MSLVSLQPIQRNRVVGPVGLSFRFLRAKYPRSRRRQANGSTHPARLKGGTRTRTSKSTPGQMTGGAKRFVRLDRNRGLDQAFAAAGWVCATGRSSAMPVAGRANQHTISARNETIAAISMIVFSL